MTVTPRTSTSAAFAIADGTTWTLTAPATVQTGDVLIVVAYNSDFNRTTSGTGFTSVANQTVGSGKGFIGWRTIASGADNTAQVTWSSAVAGGMSAVWLAGDTTGLGTFGTITTRGSSTVNLVSDGDSIVAGDFGTNLVLWMHRSNPPTTTTTGATDITKQDTGISGNNCATGVAQYDGTPADKTFTSAAASANGLTVQVPLDAIVSNTPPVANAGPDQAVLSFRTVTLDGTGSTDAEGPIPAGNYSWSQTGGSPTVTLSSSTVAQPTFRSPSTKAGTVLTFSLTVTDSGGLTDSTPDTVTITVAPHSSWYKSEGGTWKAQRITYF